VALSLNIRTSSTILIQYCAKNELLWRSNFAGNSKTHLGLNAKCLIFWTILTKFGIFQPIVMKVINIKFHWNPSSGRCEQMGRQTYRQTEMTKVISAFSNYANVPKSDWDIYIYRQCDTNSISPGCEKKVLQRKQFARRHAFCKFSGIQARVFFNFSNKMKFHEDLVDLKKTWSVILFFLSLMFDDTVCKNVAFLVLSPICRRGMWRDGFYNGFHIRRQWKYLEHVLTYNLHVYGVRQFCFFFFVISNKHQWRNLL